MAPALRVRTLRREDYPQAPAWFDALLLVLNQALGDTATALNGGLTFAENVRAELKTVEVTMPAEFPTWRAVGASGQPPFQNSWANHADTSFGVASFRMWPDGWVELTGRVAKSPATVPSTIFTLPAGYLPRANVMAAQAGNDGLGPKMYEMHVLTDGQVLTQGPLAYSGNTPVLSLHGILFQAVGPAAKADLFAAPFPMTVKTSGRFPVATCNVARVVDKTDTTSQGTIGPCSVDWQPDSAGIKLSAIWGLQPGRKYDVTLLLTAG